MTLSPERAAAIAADQQRLNGEMIRKSVEEGIVPVQRLLLESARRPPILVAAKEPPDTQNKFELVSLADFVQRPSVSTHVAKIIPAQAIMVVFGPPKSGKTFVVGDLMMHAAHGLDWHGFPIKRALRVAYMAGESIQGFKVRLRAWMQHHDNIEQHGDFKILPRAMSLPGYTMSVVDALRSFRPEIVVTDTLNAYFGSGDENSTQDMTVFVDSLRLMVEEIGCSIICIHHTGLGDQGRERGSIVLRAACDVVAQVGKDENGSGLVGFQVIAARDMEPMEDPVSLRLTRFDTDWLDDDGEPMTTCIVEAGNMPINLPGRGGRPLGATQTQLMEIIREHAATRGKGEVLVARCDIAAIAKERGISKQSVSSAWQPLADRKFIRLVEPGSLKVIV